MTRAEPPNTPNRGGFRVHPLASVSPRGGVIRIVGYSRGTDQGPRLDVFLSDAGQSFQVYLDGKRMKVLHPGKHGAGQ